jgi:ring-1,2-phenylacetyl-CoA epoxidase subunit PaaE
VVNYVSRLKAKKWCFSQFANTKLKGDALEVGKPEGKFILEPELERQNYVAFVSGSG